MQAKSTTKILSHITILFLMMFLHHACNAQKLGVNYAALNEEFSNRFNVGIVGGAVVLKVEAGTPAEAAGLMVGDIIKFFGPIEIHTDTSDLTEAIKSLDKTRPVELKVIRNNNIINLVVDFSGKTGFIKNKIQEKADSNVGTTFWVYFNEQGCSKFDFPTIRQNPNAGERYTSDNPVKIYISSLKDWHYEVKINESVTGYMQSSDDKFPRSPYFKDIKSVISDSFCSSALPPDEVYKMKIKRQNEEAEKLEKLNASRLETEKARQQLADEAAARARMPGAKIGMSAEQVLKQTSWGPPSSVNKTITARMVREQWVYENSSFLYFENGRLVAIQK